MFKIYPVSSSHRVEEGERKLDWGKREKICFRLFTFIAFSVINRPCLQLYMFHGQSMEFVKKIPISILYKYDTYVCMFECVWKCFVRIFHKGLSYIFIWIKRTGKKYISSSVWKIVSSYRLDKFFFQSISGFDVDLYLISIFGVLFGNNIVRRKNIKMKYLSKVILKNKNW